MKSTQLEEARKLWISEKSRYKEYGEKLEKEVQDVLNSNRISASYGHRIKEDSSLLKKMLKKNISYADINDKVGVRAIVNFKSDLVLADSLIQKNFGDQQ